MFKNIFNWGISLLFLFGLTLPAQASDETTEAEFAQEQQESELDDLQLDIDQTLKEEKEVGLVKKAAKLNLQAVTQQKNSEQRKADRIIKQSHRRQDIARHNIAVANKKSKETVAYINELERKSQEEMNKANESEATLKKYREQLAQLKTRKDNSKTVYKKWLKDVYVKSKEVKKLDKKIAREEKIVERLELLAIKTKEESTNKLNKLNLKKSQQLNKLSQLEVRKNKLRAKLKKLAKN